MTQRLQVDARTSARLARVRRGDTEPELAVRRALHGLGARYRLHDRDLPGSPDLANRTRKWAIFVHGCFWHAHEGCPKATVPTRNRGFWIEKFRANRERDQRVTSQLARMGYRVLTVWECETLDGNAVRRKLAALARRSPSAGGPRS